jgi:hypothetical protein
MRRAPEPARRPAGRSHRTGRRPDRQPWPLRGVQPALGRLSPAGAVAVLLAAVGLGGLLVIGPAAVGGLSMIGLLGFVLGVGVLALMKRFDAITGRTTRSATRPTPSAGWRDAGERFDRLRSDYAGYECDPIQVLRLPALADVAVPSTARFVDALAEAQALQTDEHPGEQIAARFTTAVEHAEQAWLAALEAAGRIRLSTLDPTERAGVERVVKLLTTARDTDSEHERVIAYTRARAALAKLGRAGAVHLPIPAQAALDEAARGALPE